MSAWDGALDPLFQALDLRGRRLPNRVVLPAHSPRLTGQRYLAYLEARLQSGVSMAICSSPALYTVDAYTVVPSGVPAQMYDGHADAPRPDPRGADGVAHHDRAALGAMSAQAELCHRYDALCLAQLGHTGSYATGADLHVGLSPSGLPDEMLGEATHEVTVQEIQGFLASLREGVRRAVRAGMDGVEIHSAHGLFLNSFLSPLTNRRQDHYGGSLTNRGRLLVEALEVARAELPPEGILGVRMPGSEHLAGGLDLDDGRALARLVAPHVDYLNVSGASESGRKHGVTTPAVMDGALHGAAVYEDEARALKAEVEIPVLVTGRITDPVAAAELIASGAADLVGVVRAMIADPEWLSKARSGNLRDIRRCAGDNEGCRQRTLVRGRGGGMPIGCTVNAFAGREFELAGLLPAEVPRRVVVVGGGPAGMEAARLAALRGHNVSLLERSARLGGQAITAALTPLAGGFMVVAEDLEHHLRKTDARVELDVDVDLGTLLARRPDVIVVATGARFATSAWARGGAVVHAGQVLTGEVALGRRVLVDAGFDGHRAPLLIASDLAERGHAVTLVTERILVGEAQDPGTNHVLVKRLLDLDVELLPLTRVADVFENDARLEHCLTGRAQHRRIDHVVTVRREAQDELLRVLQASVGAGGPEVMAVGDCLAPRRVMHAVLEGTRVGLSI